MSLQGQWEFGWKLSINKTVFYKQTSILRLTYINIMSLPKIETHKQVTLKPLNLSIPIHLSFKFQLTNDDKLENISVLHSRSSNALSMIKAITVFASITRPTKNIKFVKKSFASQRLRDVIKFYNCCVCSYSTSNVW